VAPVSSSPVATKKTTPSKTSAKKTTAKKPATKKPVKKAAAKKAPARKAPAKKAAPKKVVAKKAAPKKKGAAKKAPAKKAAKAPLKASPPAPPIDPRLPKPRPYKNYKFKVRDKVVYPHHGAAIITKKEKHTFDGAKQDYFVIEAITNPLVLRIPVAKASELGLRPVISPNAARKVFSTLKANPVDADATWARWFKLLQDKMSSGDIFEVATVVRDLTYAQQSKPLGPALKRMLAKARLILTSELQLALSTDEETVIKRLDKSLSHLVPEPVDV